MFCLFVIILLVQAPVIVSIFPKENIIFTSTSIRKCLYCMKTHPIQFVLAQFAQRRQWTNPRLLILNIEGATDHSCLENHRWAKYKIFPVTFLIFSIIIFRFDGFQPHHLPLILTIHMLVSINQTLRTLIPPPRSFSLLR